MKFLPLSRMLPSRVVESGDPNEGETSGNTASKKPNAMLLLAQVGLTRVSPNPANAPPWGFITCCSTKLGTPGMSNWALEQSTPKTTGSCVPLTIDGTSPLCSVGSAQPPCQPWSRCRIIDRPSL
jgi:hypothetical protein